MIIHCKYDELVLVESLRPYSRNRNEHSKEQIERLAKLLLYQGIRAPIVVTKTPGGIPIIAKGHGTVEAIKHNGWKEAPVVFQEFEDEDQLYAFVQSDNAIASWSELNLAGINSDLEILSPDFDIDNLGLKDFVLEPMDKYADQDGDAIPEQVETICKPGDLWVLGEHRLLCGDSTDKSQVERLMNGEKADMVFTDPPYNLAGELELHAKEIRKESYGKLQNSEWDKNFSFDKTFPIFETLLDNGTIYICASHFTAREIFDWLISWADVPGYCVWSKTNPMPSLRKRHWTWATELICYGTIGKHIFNFPNEGHAKNVWEFSSQTSAREHPTQKPVGLIEHAIKHSSTSGQLVVDLFLGSGSTLIACEKTNRRCFGMEIDPHYCDVIIARWEKFTGKKATMSDCFKELEA